MSISNLKPTYIQCGDKLAIDISKSFGVYVQSMPLLKLPKVKDISVRSWKGEQGDEEFISPFPTFESFEISIDFAYKGDIESANLNIYRFFAYIQGLEFNIFDFWRLSGYRMRYSDYDERTFIRNNEDVVEFTFKFKVNNPLCYGIRINGNTFEGTANVGLVIYYSDGFYENISGGKDASHVFESNDNNFAIICPDRLDNRNMNGEELFRFAGGTEDLRVADILYRAINIK